MESEIVFKDGTIITFNNVINFFHDTRNGIDYIYISTEKGFTTEYRLDDIEKFALVPTHLT